jgi:tRNA pseudouridine synthase 10
MNVLEKATKILDQPVCDHCLGRQFGQLLHGYSNSERGSLIRTMVAMSIDKEDYKGSVDKSNFSDFSFHNLEEKMPKHKECFVCKGFFKNLDKWVEKIKKISRGYEFRTFLVGTKLSFEFIKREEDLWERIGIDYCEPLKAEINREIGKRVEKLGFKSDLKQPDVNFILDVSSGKVRIESNPLFIYGEYQKLKRGIPQTKWPSGKYKNSVEQIIARPFMIITKGSDHKLHGAGREDIDARCFAWRPFVLEIISPKKRSFSIKETAKKIKKDVKVRNVRPSDIAEVRKIKEMKSDKTYRLYVNCSKIKKSDLKNLEKLVGVIKQKTPQRVVHRRADLFRKRKVLHVKTKYISSKKFLFEARCESGLYVKELVSGDEGRTYPSVSSILSQKCKPLLLDVLKIHKK